MADEGQPAGARSPGWHRDPFGRFYGRYWDGERWTDQVVKENRSQAKDPPDDPTSSLPGAGPVSAPASVAVASENGGRSWRTWHLLAAAGVAFLLGVGAGASGGDEDETVAAGGQVTTETTTGSTLSHAQVIPPSSTPAPTPPPTPATTTTVAQPADIVTFTGSSDKNTEAFSVRSPWRIKWRVTGGAGVAIALHDQSGARIEYISADPGTDESIIRRACSGCYLKISPFGSTYTITINGIAA